MWPYANLHIFLHIYWKFQFTNFNGLGARSWSFKEIFEIQSLAPVLFFYPVSGKCWGELLSNVLDPNLLSLAIQGWIELCKYIGRWFCHKIIEIKMLLTQTETSLKFLLPYPLPNLLQCHCKGIYADWSCWFLITPANFDYLYRPITTMGGLCILLLLKRNDSTT